MPAANAEPDEHRRDHRADAAHALGPADSDCPQRVRVVAREHDVDAAVRAEDEEPARAEQR